MSAHVRVGLGCGGRGKIFIRTRDWVKSGMTGCPRCQAYEAPLTVEFTKQHSHLAGASITEPPSHSTGSLPSRPSSAPSLNRNEVHWRETSYQCIFINDVHNLECAMAGPLHGVMYAHGMRQARFGFGLRRGGPTMQIPLQRIVRSFVLCECGDSIIRVGSRGTVLLRSWISLRTAH